MKDIFVRVPYHRTVFATFENLFESKYKVNDVDPKPIEFNYKKLKNNYFVVRMLHKTDLKKGFKIRGKVFPEICREKKTSYIEKNTVEIIGTTVVNLELENIQLDDITNNRYECLNFDFEHVSFNDGENGCFVFLIKVKNFDMRNDFLKIKDRFYIISEKREL